MTIPIGLNADQIGKMIRLIQDEMCNYLGYTVEVKDISKIGEDVSPRVYGLRDEDYTDTVQEKFNDICYAKLCQIANLHGEQ